MSDQPIDFSERGTEPPVHELFTELRAKWLERNKGATSTDLAARFGVHKQTISQWATGTDPSKRAPWWCMLTLAKDLNLEIRLADDGARLVRKHRKKAA